VGKVGSVKKVATKKSTAVTGLKRCWSLQKKLHLKCHNRRAVIFSHLDNFKFAYEE